MDRDPNKLFAQIIDAQAKLVDCQQFLQRKFDRIIKMFPLLPECSETATHVLETSGTTTGNVNENNKKTAEPKLGKKNTGQLTGQHNPIQWPVIRDFFHQANVCSQDFMTDLEADSQICGGPTTETCSDAGFMQVNAGGLRNQLEESLVQELYDSYMSNVWILYPTGNPRELKQMTDYFIAEYSPSASSIGLKRKFSESDSGARPSTTIHPTPTNADAVVLLVLALGSLCDHQQFLVQGDLPPGCAYWTQALQILNQSQQHGNHDLPFIQAHILLCLYWGQIGISLKSHAHLKIAADLVVAEMMKPLRDPNTAELLLFMFWSVYKLDSDISAELNHLKSSGIEKLYETTKIPDFIPGYTRDDKSIELYSRTLNIESTVAYFTAQLSMGKIINSYQNNIYNESQLYIQNEIDYHWQWIIEWRKVQEKVNLAWQDGAPLATDLNGARIRSEFYGAVHITLRPFLCRMLYPTEEPASSLEECQ